MDEVEGFIDVRAVEYNGVGSQNITTRFRVERLSGIQASYEMSWRIKGLLPAEGLVFIYGPPSVGKSFAVIHLGLAIAGGLEFAGCKTNKAPVVYVAAEAGGGARKRLFAAKEALGLDDNSPFAMVAVAPNLGRADGDADLLITAISDQMNDIELNGAVIILDTVARVTPGMEENSSKDTGVFIANADRIAKEFGGLVIGVHHPGKNLENGMRGSSALLGASDTVIAISKSDGETRIATVQKQKDGEDGQSFTFALGVVEVGFDEDGDAVTTCVLSNISSLTRQGDLPDIKRQRIPRGLRLLIDIIGSAISDTGTHIKPWADGPLVWAVEKTILRRAYFAAKPDDTEDTKRRAFDRSLTKAIDERHVVSAELQGQTYIWNIGSARGDN
jgi:hypothetical protein